MYTTFIGAWTLSAVLEYAGGVYDERSVVVHASNSAATVESWSTAFEEATANPHLRRLTVSLEMYVKAIVAGYCYRNKGKRVRVLNVGGDTHGGKPNLVSRLPEDVRGQIEYYVLDVANKTREGGVYIQGDIADKDLEVGVQFDILITENTFEHVLNPWDATANVLRMLKENGVFLFLAPFSWRYHPYPYDTYRYSHVGAQYLFGRMGGLRTVFAGYSQEPIVHSGFHSKKDATLSGLPFKECIETVYVAERNSTHEFDLTELEANPEYS